MISKFPFSLPFYTAAYLVGARPCTPADWLHPYLAEPRSVNRNHRNTVTSWGPWTTHPHCGQTAGSQWHAMPGWSGVTAHSVCYSPTPLPALLWALWWPHSSEKRTSSIVCVLRSNAWHTYCVLQLEWQGRRNMFGMQPSSCNGSILVHRHLLLINTDNHKKISSEVGWLLLYYNYYCYCYCPTITTVTATTAAMTTATTTPTTTAVLLLLPLLQLGLQGLLPEPGLLLSHINIQLQIVKIIKWGTNFLWMCFGLWIYEHRP